MTLLCFSGFNPEKLKQQHEFLWVSKEVLTSEFTLLQMWGIFWFVCKLRAWRFLSSHAPSSVCFSYFSR
jgi:hypothetical protein